MPSYTQNLNLYLPSPLDDLDIHPPLAQNFQNIDDKLGGMADTTGSVSYTYNADQSIDTITTPTKTYQYNYSGGQLDNVEETDGTETIRTSYTFDTNGNLTNVTRAVI